MAQPELLEVFSCQGGAAEGYRRAGWKVTCVDLAPQPRNPFPFYRADALDFIANNGHRFQAITGGPPCQFYTKAQRIQKNEHPDLIAATREVMRASGKLYVIENVEEAKPHLNDPITLCGYTFGLRTYRHRLFESNAIIRQPPAPGASAPNGEDGPRARTGRLLPRGRELLRGRAGPARHGGPVDGPRRNPGVHPARLCRAHRPSTNQGAVMTVTETPPPARPRREKRTTPVHAVVRQSTGDAFRLWADKRGLTVSGAVEGLMVDALLREVTASPLGPLTRDLPPETLARIVAVLRARD